MIADPRPEPPPPERLHVAEADAERAILGSVLLDPATILDVQDVVRTEDFTVAAHRTVWAAMLRLADTQKPIDLVTLAAEIGSDLASIGGSGFLSSIYDDVPSTANVAQYAAIVHEAAVRRRMLRVANEIGKLARDKDTATVDAVARMESLALGVGQDLVSTREPELVSRLLRTDVWPAIEARANAPDHVRGIKTGFFDLDHTLSGLQRADLLVLAGRPSMGKTSLALNIAANVARDTGPVLVFSLEMIGSQLVERLLASESRVDSHRLRNGTINDTEWARLARGADIVNALPLSIRDDPALRAIDMRSIARRTAKKFGRLALIVVDYLQLLEVDNHGGSHRESNREQEVAGISRSLKSLARELDVPVLALSQLSRGLERRPDKRPVLSDLRESGAIEQDADVIAFVYRDEVYNSATKDKGVAEIIIGKQRNGPTGTIRVAFQREYTRFVNLAESHDDEPPPKPRQRDWTRNEG